jgi:hypothetical protein
VNWIALHGFLDDGKPDAATKMWKEGFEVYPLAKSANPPAMEFISSSKKKFNIIYPNNYEYFEELHAVIDREPIEMLDPGLRGLFSAIGIQMGKPFAHEYLKDEGMGGRHLNARTHFYYFATVNTPMTAVKLAGKGSKYAWAREVSIKGNRARGGRNGQPSLAKSMKDRRNKMKTAKRIGGKHMKTKRSVTLLSGVLVAANLADRQVSKIIACLIIVMAITSCASVPSPKSISSCRQKKNSSTSICFPWAQ